MNDRTQENGQNYTFANLVIGDSNRLAYAVAVAVAQRPREIYNPLFLYAESGLGKTHMLNAIQNEMLRNKPDIRTLNVSASTFAEDFIDSLKLGRIPGNTSARRNFKNRYRNSIDVLLIDDIQFLIGKERTQTEFLNTFNELHLRGKQIIITSDRPPRHMTALEEGLRTRFSMGIVVDIGYPDYEMRVRILESKRRILFPDLNIPEEQLAFIAANAGENIRMLEGALRKLGAYYRFNQGEDGNQVKIEEVLADIVPAARKFPVTPARVMEIVADYYDVTVPDIAGRDRNSRYSMARQVCMYLIYEICDLSARNIGNFLGNRDISTVKYGIKKITELMEKDNIFQNNIEMLIGRIGNNT